MKCKKSVFSARNFNIMNGKIKWSTKKREVLRAVLAILVAKNVDHIDVYSKMNSSQSL